MKQKKRNFYLSLEKGDLLPVLLMLPTLLIIFGVMIVPLGYGFMMSLYEVGFGGNDLGENFRGLNNYLKFFKDMTAKKALLNTIIFSFGAITGDFFLGTVFSVMLLKISRKISVILRPVMTMPLLISPLIVGLIWRYIYDPNGILYWLLNQVGLGIKHFPGVTSADTALLSTMIAHWWQVTPFVVIILTAGLLSIPEEYYEASRVDGASFGQEFFYITLPLLTNVYMVIFLISGVDTVKVFDIIYSLTGGGPNNATVSTSIYAYKQAFELSNLSYAMSISFITMLVTFLIFGIPFIRHNLKKAKSY